MANDGFYGTGPLLNPPDSQLCLNYSSVKYCSRVHLIICNHLSLEYLDYGNKNPNNLTLNRLFTKVRCT